MHRKEKSCGLLFRYNKRIEYLIVRQRNGRHWGFPKGHVEGNETEKETSEREVYEETGINVDFLENFRETIRYSVRDDDKTVVFFLCRALNEKVRPQHKEILEYKWLAFSDAISLLTYQDMKEVLKKANTFLISGNPSHS